MSPGWKEGPNCWFMAMTEDLWITFWRLVDKGGGTYTNACCAARLIVVDSARTRRIDRNAKTKPEQQYGGGKGACGRASCGPKFHQPHYATFEVRLGRLRLFVGALEF